jgi:hypothetical protein
MEDGAGDEGEDAGADRAYLEEIVGWREGGCEGGAERRQIACFVIIFAGGAGAVYKKLTKIADTQENDHLTQRRKPTGGGAVVEF